MFESASYWWYRRPADWAARISSAVTSVWVPPCTTRMPISAFATANGFHRSAGKSAQPSYWRATSMVWSPLCGVAPLNVTPATGIDTPGKRAMMPPLGRLGFSTNT